MTYYSAHMSDGWHSGFFSTKRAALNAAVTHLAKHPEVSAKVWFEKDAYDLEIFIRSGKIEKWED